MDFTLEVVIFYILLLDAVMANLFSWSGNKQWYNKNFKLFSRYFPLTRGWTTYYLILVLWMGVIIIRAGGSLF